MPCDSCLSRRDFLGTAASVAGLVALSGCGDGWVSAPVRIGVLPSGPLVVKVGDVPDLATTGRLVKLSGQAIAIKRIDASTFDAYSMLCTHQRCVVNITGGQFVCPCHGSRFRDDGGVLQGPAAQSLAKFTTSYEPATDLLTIS